MFRRLTGALVDCYARTVDFVTGFRASQAGSRPDPPEDAEPPLPPLPPAPLVKTEGRRRFLHALGTGLGSLAALAVAIPAVWYLLGPLLRHVPSVWRPVGKADSFPEGHTTKVSFRDAGDLAWSGGSGITVAWLRHEKGDRFIAFAVYCSHLGCPVRWESSAELFMCPCHGGVYYLDGTVAAGPPPRPLPRYPVRVRNGEVEIRTTRLPIAGEI